MHAFKWKTRENVIPFQDKMAEQQSEMILEDSEDSESNGFFDSEDSDSDDCDEC